MENGQEKRAREFQKWRKQANLSVDDFAKPLKGVKISTAFNWNAGHIPLDIFKQEIKRVWGPDCPPVNW